MIFTQKTYTILVGVVFRSTIHFSARTLASPNVYIPFRLYILHELFFISCALLCQTVQHEHDMRRRGFHHVLIYGCLSSTFHSFHRFWGEWLKYGTCKAFAFWFAIYVCIYYTEYQCWFYGGVRGGGWDRVFMIYVSLFVQSGKYNQCRKRWADVKLYSLTF